MREQRRGRVGQSKRGMGRGTNYARPQMVCVKRHISVGVMTSTRARRASTTCRCLWSSIVREEQEDNMLKQKITYMATKWKQTWGLSAWLHMYIKHLQISLICNNNRRGGSNTDINLNCWWYDATTSKKNTRALTPLTTIRQKTWIQIEHPTPHSYSKPFTFEPNNRGDLQIVSGGEARKGWAGHSHFGVHIWRLCSINANICGALFPRSLDGMRHYFRVFTTWVLGWTCRKDEGVPNGYPKEAIFYLRVLTSPIP